MLLAQDNDVVQAFSPDRPISRSAKPFCQGDPGAIGLSRMPMARSWRGDDAAIDPVAIADEVARSLFPGNASVIAPLTHAHVTPCQDPGHLWREITIFDRA